MRVVFDIDLLAVAWVRVRVQVPPPALPLSLWRTDLPSLVVSRARRDQLRCYLRYQLSLHPPLIQGQKIR